MALQTDLPANSMQNFRPLADFPPTEWGFSFVSFSFPEMEFESYNRQVEELKSIVMAMLMASRKDPVENVEFINLLCRLGVSYHFETEIEDQVVYVHDALPNLLENNDHDLHTVALLFRVLRQYGCKVSSDVFKNFKDANGEFKKTITSDVKGNLSLHEAAHLSVNGEQILDEALEFSRTNLESLATRSGPRLGRHIKYALIRPIHKTVQRLEAREYISFYEEEDFRNETLLKFAKLDFNRVQLLHQQELSTLSSWWKDLNLVEELPYARDRIVEMYFWVNSMHFEPQYALARILSTKLGALITVIDDTYDAYSTYEELQHFTEAVIRCNIDAIDQLPTDSMKVLYRALLTYFDDVANEVSKNGKSFTAVNYVKEEMKEMIRSYIVEAQWCNDRFVPPLKEYVRNGKISIGFMATTTVFFVVETARIEELEWLTSKAKISEAGCLFLRLMNDIVTHEFEQKREHCASAIECYMKEYKVSMNEAVKELQKTSADAWKDINEDCLKPTSISMNLLNVCVNNARATDVVYESNDAYTNASCLKGRISLLFVEKIPLQS
ncbi:terpene synthase 6 [Populus alba x Populus x berolinensis]|nr:terpene synthase 6 [Populus alba x Populus x berolinensis]